MPLAGSMAGTASTSSLATRLHVVDRADIHVARTTLPEIAEPQAALLVEHQIIRAVQLPVTATFEQGLDLAGCEIDPLKRTTEIFGRRRRARHQGTYVPATS